jgi:hypothetical protein
MGREWEMSEAAAYSPFTRIGDGEKIRNASVKNRATKKT